MIVAGLSLLPWTAEGMELSARQRLAGLRPGSA
jgi:hypothetical protein